MVDSGMVDSGMVDSGMVDSGMVDSGMVDSGVDTEPDPGGKQSWSKILSPDRAVDWSHAGVKGGIPNRTSICADILTSDTTSQIQAKINACPQDGVVRFPKGTWTLTSSLYSNKGVVLRGAGPKETKIILGSSTNIFIGSVGTGGQGGYPSKPYVAVDWTGGLEKGASVLEVTSNAGMKVGQTIMLDQYNDPKLVFEAGTEGKQAAGRSDIPDFSSRTGDRRQFQTTEITAVDPDGVHITVSPPVDYTHDQALDPEVFFWNPNGNPHPGNIKYAGVEDMRIDANNQDRAICITFCSECWVQNVQIDNVARGGVTTWLAYRVELRDNYISANKASSGPTQYAIEIIESPYTKIENNLVYNVTSPVMPASDDALVVGYNYAYSAVAGAQFGALEPHNSHNDFHLYEGNVVYMVSVDNVWGSSSRLTFFRNRISGLSPNKTWFRVPFLAGAHQRYLNLVGNVFGIPGQHVRYEVVDTTTPWGGDDFIYSYGFWNRWEMDREPYDLVTKTSLMRWGNWDVVTYAANGNTDGVRWCTGSGVGNAACTTDETASAEPRFPGLANPSKVLPPSFYLSSKPSWFGSVQWPPIGPDVACTGDCIADTAGHAAKIPAQLCYENGAKDSGGVLVAFDANDCYPGR